MSIRLLLTDLLIPPPSLLYVALLGLLLFRSRRRSRLAAAIVSAAVLGLGILALPVVGQALIVSLERDLQRDPPASRGPQAIIILSAEAEHTPSGLRVGPLTLERLAVGARLWREVHLPVLVSGGPIRPGDEPLAHVMARAMEDLFQVQVTWIEDRSLTTWQNAQDSASILAPRDIRSVYIVTHAWHEKRALIAFRHFGFTAIAAPVALDVISGGGFLPEAGGWSRSYHALHEWVGIAAYRLRAWLEPVTGAGRSARRSQFPGRSSNVA